MLLSPRGWTICAARQPAKTASNALCTSLYLSLLLLVVSSNIENGSGTDTGGYAVVVE